MTYQQNYTFGGWTIDTYNKKIYPRVFPNSDAYPSIIDSSYCKAPPSGSPGIVYLSGSITYHIGEWATEPDPDASVAPTIPSIAFLYNGETTGWQSTWPQSDHSIPADYSSYTTNSGSCTNGYLTTGTASGYYSNTTIGSSNKINFQTLMDAGYTTLNVTFNKITWPFTTNLANNIVQFQYNMWVGIADSANENISFKNTDIITPLRGQEEKGGFTGLTFGANVTSATTATLSLVDLTKNSTRTNGHLVFGVIHPNTDNSASLEIQIGKIWVS
ncbi:MAG: hypothetical protein IKB70_07795 [Bacilli bacterium]|nr:hypothetical protein [Bacilli bacterium]